MLDVVASAQLLAQIDHPVGVILPVDGFCHGEVVRSTDLEQIHETMGFLNDLEAALTVESRLQADPGKNTRVVKLFQCINSIAWQGRAALPLETKAIVQAGEGRGESVTIRAEEIQIAQCSTSPLCQCADTHPVTLEDGDNFAGHPSIPRMVRISCKAQHDLLGNPGHLILSRVSFQSIQVARALYCSGVKKAAIQLNNLRHVTIDALVAAATIWISGQQSIFPRLAFGCIDERTSSDGNPIAIDGISRPVINHSFSSVSSKLNLMHIIQQFYEIYNRQNWTICSGFVENLRVLHRIKTGQNQAFLALQSTIYRQKSENCDYHTIYASKNQWIYIWLALKIIFSAIVARLWVVGSGVFYDTNPIYGSDCIGNPL